MGDVIFVLVIVAFFAAMVLLVRACDHVIGPEDLVTSSREVPPPAAGDDGTPA
jgi:hypothetical protein